MNKIKNNGKDTQQQKHQTTNKSNKIIKQMTTKILN